MSTVRINPSLHEVIAAARHLGVEIHAPHDGGRRPVDYVTVTHPELPGIVIISRPDYPSLGEQPTLSVPVKPSIKHGSSVALDHEGTIPNIMGVVAGALCSGEIRPRWVPDTSPVPVDRRVGRALVTEVI